MADQDAGPDAEAPALKADAIRKRAKQAYKAKDFREAGRLYGELLAGDPAEPVETVVADRMGYAAVLTSLNKTADAANELEKAVALAPADARIRQKSGELLSRAGRHNEAVEQFTEAVRLEPDVADHHWRLALELRTLGREAEAAEEVARCLKIEPTHTEAQLLQMEDLIMASPERDGQFEMIDQHNVDDFSDGGPDAELAKPSLLSRHPRAVMAFEAVFLFVVALWIRSLFA